MMNDVSHTPGDAPDATSLVKAIFQHKAEWNAYLAASLEDDDAPRAYEPSLHQLQSWSKPAGDKMEATEAVRLALEFYEVGDSEVIPSMLKAALGFLDGRVSA